MQKIRVLQQTGQRTVERNIIPDAWRVLDHIWMVYGSRKEGRKEYDIPCLKGRQGVRWPIRRRWIRKSKRCRELTTGESWTGLGKVDYILYDISSVKTHLSCTWPNGRLDLLSCRIKIKYHDFVGLYIVESADRRILDSGTLGWRYVILNCLRRLPRKYQFETGNFNLSVWKWVSVFDYVSVRTFRSPHSVYMSCCLFPSFSLSFHNLLINADMILTRAKKIKTVTMMVRPQMVCGKEGNQITEDGSTVFLNGLR